ncbi:MAG: YkgJ family cysteine cluster protein [Planctomycetota bacterium]
MNSTPWYAEGLRFECTQCGGCCSGEPGYVWVDEAEIAAMAREVKMHKDEFCSLYVRRVGSRFSLVEYDNGDCIFLDTESRGCRVYGARPIQCRTWPFWNSTINTPGDWEETCKECPGAGTGRLYSLEEIEIQRNKKRV